MGVNHKNFITVGYDQIQIFVMHLSMLSHLWGGEGGGKPSKGGGFDLTSLSMFGTIDHLLSPRPGVGTFDFNR